MAQRGVAPVVGVTIMVLVTVVLAALVGAMLFGVGLDDPPEAAITAEAAYDTTNETTEVALTHASGDRFDVKGTTVRVAVNGDPLKDQPTVPSVGMTGFRHAPTGPFNSGNGNTDTNWSAGEIAGFEIAKSNDPNPRPGDRITVRIFADGQPVAAAKATVE